jgi:PPOX class probable F420-dependent enzyme
LSVPLSPNAQAFLKEKVFAHLATLMKDGWPQVTPTWVDTDGENILVFTGSGRVKANNMERDERVALSIMGLDSAYRCLWVQGRVKGIGPDPDDEPVATMAELYRGDRGYSVTRGKETRLRVVIEPLRIATMGID